MRKKLLWAFLSALLSANAALVYAQCPPDIIGQNIVVNGDFEQGDVLFDSPYNSWNDPGYPCCGRDWSAPGEYWVHDNAADFNPGSFSSIPSPVSGGNMMLVDADCNPGETVWSQVVDVTPGTNYYFSLWIASIHPENPAQLAFEVNGVQLGTAVNAPATVDNWVFYEDVWNSGAMSGPVTLRIIEQSGVGCTDGDDFAIDDINFIPGCQFGTPGPAPYLGENQTLCGKGGAPVTIHVGVPDPTNPNYNILWSTGETTPSIDVNAPGTYSVCVDSLGSCTRSDVIVIEDDYTINLGPDRNLCDPPTTMLDAVFSGPGVTYLWTHNGIPVPGGTNQTLEANQAGTYGVIVDDPVCGTREAQVNISSTTITANNAQFCSMPSSVDLSVNGAGGTYSWYDAPTGGSLVQSNSTTYTTPPISATTTWYVEDETVYDYTVGHSLSDTPPLSDGGYQDQGNVHMTFDALTDLTLEAITIRYNGITSGPCGGGVPAGPQLTFNLKNSGGTIIESVSPPIPCGGVDNVVTVNLNFDVPAGSGYRLDLQGSAGGMNVYNYGNGASYPMSYPDLLDITGGGVNWNNNGYGPFFDWQIAARTHCDRVPVVATQFCPPACAPPSDAQILNPSPVVMCTGGNVELNANAEAGYEYTWIRNGVAVAGPVVNMFNYTTTQTGTYSVRITEAGNPFCFLQSPTVEVVEFDISAVNLPDDYSTCNPTQTLDAGISGSDVTYIWEHNAAVIPGATERTYTIDDLGAYRVIVSHPVCGTATDVVVVSAGTYNINLGFDRDLCTPTSYNLNAGFSAPGVTYQWQSPPGTDIPDATSQSLFVNTPGHYAIVVDHPFCGQRTDDVVITSSVGTPVNGTFCSEDNETANLEIVGTGPYEWYDAPTGGTLLTTGNTYTTPAITGTTTYYVESTGSFSATIGHSLTDSPPLGGGNTVDQGNVYMTFNALNDFTLDSVTIRYNGVTHGPCEGGVPQGAQLNITLKDAGGVPITSAAPLIPCGGTNNEVTVYLGFDITGGESYRIDFQGSTGGVNVYNYGSGASYPMNYPDIADITNGGVNWDNNGYGPFFDWQVSVGTPCDRVPVVATDLAPNCTTPVSWLNFTATSRDRDVLLEWATASEENNDFFLVQRSTDGVTWETIGQVPGSGTTSTINHYSFIDQYPLGGVSYYRIMQQDYDGSTGYSVIRTVNRDYFYFSVMPNPFLGTTTIVFASQSDAEIDIEVVDVNGKTVFARPGHRTNQPLEFGHDLASGMYVVRAINNQTVHTFKVVKN